MKGTGASNESFAPILRKALVSYASAAALCAAQIVYYAPRLPDVVASHFTFDGAPNGWAGKDVFFIHYAVLIVFVAGAFAAIGLLLPRIPKSLINMPNKEYWLAPERRTATLRLLSDRLVAMGGVTLLFLIVVFQLSIQANLRTEGVRLGSEASIVGGAYFAYVLIWVIRLFLVFRRPRQKQENPTT